MNCFSTPAGSQVPRAATPLGSDNNRFCFRFRGYRPNGLNPRLMAGILPGCNHGIPRLDLYEWHAAFPSFSTREGRTPVGSGCRTGPGRRLFRKSNVSFPRAQVQPGRQDLLGTEHKPSAREVSARVCSPRANERSRNFFGCANDGTIAHAQRVSSVRCALRSRRFLDFRVVGVGRRTGCFVQSRFSRPGRAGSARCSPRRPAGLGWRTLFCAGQVIYTVPGTLLVFISSHARFPSPELVTPPRVPT
jgi:hypothetical protein